MSGILKPGYVRWDGTKYVTDPEVEIVGPAGPPGLSGADGTNGINAFSNTTADYTQPAASFTVTIHVNDTSWLGNNQTIYIANGGYYTITNVLSGTDVIITNLGIAGIPPGVVINQNALVSPAGLRGATGVSAYATTGSNFVQPSVDNNIGVVLSESYSTAWMAIGEIIYIANGGYYQVFSITDQNNFVVTNIGYPGNAISGFTVNSGSIVTPGGLIGPSDIVYISPLGTGDDDWPRLIGILNANAYKKTVVMGAGTWYAQSVVDLISGVSLKCEPGVNVISTISPSGGGDGGNTNCPFHAVGAPVGAATNLAANSVLGATSITVTSLDPAMVPGSYVLLASTVANVGHIYTIVSTSGSSNPYTINLLEPQAYPFLTSKSASCQSWSPILDINLDFTGSTITGTGDRYFEIGSSINGVIRGVRAIRSTTGTVRAFLGSFDIAGRGNQWIDCRGDGGNFTNCGWALESNIGSSIRNCAVSNVTTGGGGGAGIALFLPSSPNCIIDGVDIVECTAGIRLLCSDATDTTGSSNCRVDHILITDQVGGNGLQIGDGDNFQIDNFSIVRGTGQGLYMQQQIVSGPTNVHIGSLIVNGLSQTALFCSGSQIICDSLQADNCACPVQVFAGGGNQSICRITRLTSTNCTGASSSNGIFTVQGANSFLDITDGSWYNNTSNSVIGSCGDNVSASTVIIRSGKTVFSGAGNKDLCQVYQLSTVKISNFTSSGGAYGIYFYAGASYMYRGPNVDLTGFSNPYTFNGGGVLSNFGTFTMNGLTEVTTTGNFLADTPIMLSLATKGSTPNLALPYFSTAQIAGTFYTKGVVVNANDVFNWIAL